MAVEYGYLTIAAVGDINHDGVPDLILKNNGYYSDGITPGGTGDYYVIFGTTNMGTNSASPWPIPPTGLDPTTLNGTNGFIIHTGNTGVCVTGGVTVGDINGDGIDDLFIGTGCTSYVIFGGPTRGDGTWLGTGVTTLNVANLAGYTGTNGTSGVRINMVAASNVNSGIFGNSATPDSLVSWGYPFPPAIGKVDDSPYNALIFIGPLYRHIYTSAGGFVIYGKPNTCSPSPCDSWANTTTPIDATQLNGTNGFQIYSSNATLLPTPSPMGNGPSADFDNDTYADLMIADNHAAAPGGVTGSYFLIYGRKRADWTSALTTVNGLPVIDLAAELAAVPNRATQFYSIAHPLIGYGPNAVDANSDGIKDLLFTGYWSTTTVLYGGNRWPATFNIDSPIAANGFAISNSSLPSWWHDSHGQGYYITTAAMADVNGDNKADLLLGYADASPQNRTDAGGVLVMYQPSGGWSTLGGTISYSQFKWDGTDSFQIYGPAANSQCDGPFVGDVRSGDSNKPEIMISCRYYGENSYGSIYGLYKNKGWPSSIDLNKLN